MIRTSSLFYALLPAAALLATACHFGDEDGLHDAGLLDTGVPPDSGVEPDAGVAPDAEAPDATTPPRRVMVEKKLFGTMPLDNAVVDPLFDLAAQNWYAISDPNGAGASFAPTTKHHYGTIPSGMPAIEQKKGTVSSNDVIVLGNIAPFSVPAVASVWIGRHAADGERGARAAVAITTVVGQVQAFELQPDGEAPITADDVVWTRYTGEITTAPVGISTFVISDDSELPYLVSGPVVTMTRDKAKPTKLAVKRAPLPRETRALRMVQKKRLDRMVPSTRARPSQQELLRRALAE